MTDYPHDCGGRMSQVHSGSKMLSELPSEMASPAVRVNNKIYFANELVQLTDGSYFIPERFFYAPLSPAGPEESRPPPQPEESFFLEELCALGREVTRGEVCTIRQYFTAAVIVYCD